MKIVVLGLSITSSWGNGHATTYRGLVRELGARGHDVLFLEKDVPWYASHRDLPRPPFCTTALYASVEELKDVYADDVREAELVIVGSYVPDGIAIGEWVTQTARGVTAFYDIDTPVTVAAMQREECTYLSVSLVPRYDLYLSFTGGPLLERLRRQFGARRPRPLYCSFDPQSYYPEDRERRWDLGYLGTYSACRQPALTTLMLDAAVAAPSARMVVAGPQYPATVQWPANVERIDHLPPPEHRSFYTAQRFTLNVTRSDMVAAGYSPSVRLFEAAACGTPIISDAWSGLETFFRAGTEIFLARSATDTLRILQQTTERQRLAVGRMARARVLAEHTAAHRAVEVEQYVAEVVARSPRTRVTLGASP